MSQLVEAVAAVPLEIDPAAEGPFYPITELPRRPFMPRPGGKPLSTRTVIRWALRHKEPRLRTLMVGGRRCTCDGWSMEFFQALTAATDRIESVHAGRTPMRRQRQVERAERTLEAEGL